MQLKRWSEIRILFWQQWHKKKEIVLEAVAQNGVALEYAAEEMTMDKAVVLVAVAESGYALELVAEEMQGDT